MNRAANIIAVLLFILFVGSMSFFAGYLTGNFGERDRGFQKGYDEAEARFVKTIKGDRDRVSITTDGVTLGSGKHVMRCAARFVGENGQVYVVRHSPFGGGMSIAYRESGEAGTEFTEKIHLSGAKPDPLFRCPCDACRELERQEAEKQ